MTNPPHREIEGSAREPLRRAQEVARGLLESAPDAMILVNEHGCIELVNQRAEELFGYSRDELLGEPVEILVPDRLRSDHRSHARDYSADPSVRAMGSGLDLSGRRKDGTEFPAEISLSPFRFGGRNLVSSAIRDVSQRRRVESELRTARNEAEHASRSKSSFLAAASHDLRQPLQAARFYLEVLESELENPPETVHKIGRCLESLRNLLNRLMDLSKVDAGTVVPSRRAVDVGVLLQELVTELAPLAAAKGLDLRTAGVNMRLDTDPVLFERIVKNLAVNAIRYTDRGGVLLAARQRGDRVAVQVWDTGIGIPMTESETIFEEFYQLGGRGRDKEGSFGLGLAIVKRLTALLGHGLRMSSEVGRGSMFEVLVPAAVMSEVTRDEDRAAALQPAAEGLVVVIEDESAVLDSLRALLELDGQQVVAVASAEEAMAALAEQGQGAPDLVVSDFRLGEGRTGLEALERIRARYGLGIPAFVLTGDTSLSRLTRLGRERNFEVLHKPVDPGELRLLLARHLSRPSPPSPLA